MKHIALKFQGNQSWSVSEKFNLKPTEILPPKSAVIGLIANAMGLDYSDREAVASLSEIPVDTMIIKHGYCQPDYQIANSDPQNQTTKMGTKERPKGGINKPKHDDSIIVQREFTSDFAVGVVLNVSDNALAKSIVDAIERPARNLYLGKKCYPVSHEFLTGVYDHYQDALKNMVEGHDSENGYKLRQEFDLNRQSHLNCSFFGLDPDNEALDKLFLKYDIKYIRDNPKSFAIGDRKYESRCVLDTLWGVSA